MEALLLAARAAFQALEDQNWCFEGCKRVVEVHPPPSCLDIIVVGFFVVFCLVQGSSSCLDNPAYWTKQNSTKKPKNLWSMGNPWKAEIHRSGTWSTDWPLVCDEMCSLIQILRGGGGEWDCPSKRDPTHLLTHVVCCLCIPSWLGGRATSVSVSRGEVLMRVACASERLCIKTVQSHNPYSSSHHFQNWEYAKQS